MVDGHGTTLVDRPTGPVGGPGASTRALGPERLRNGLWAAPDSLVTLATLAGAIAILGIAAYALRNVWVGDAAVYLPYARNAAHGHFFQFNPGQFSSGATSPLWGVLLGIPYVFGLGLAGAKAFALIATVAALAAVIVAAGRLSGSFAAGTIGGLFVVGAVTWYALELYESALVVGAVAVSLIVMRRVVMAWGRGDAAPTGVVVALATSWALLPLARPDAAIVVAAEAVALTLTGLVPWRRAASTTFSALAAAAIPAAAYYGYSLVHLGTYSTSGAERTFALHEGAQRWIGPFYFSTDALHQLFATYWVFVTIPGLLGLGLLARGRVTRWAGVTGGLVFVVYLGLLTFVSPGLTDTPRYLLPITPLLAVGVARCISAVGGSRLRWAVLVLALALIGGLSINYLHNRVVWLRSLGLTQNEVFERDAVVRVNALARPGDTLLAYEVQLRYFLRSDVAVLSEDGITDAKVRPYQTPAGMSAFVERYHPRWWIADRNVATRPYMRGSVLDRVYSAFEAHPGLTRETVDRITFALVARRSRPLVAGFGGWQLLFRLSYGG